MHLLPPRRIAVLVTALLVLCSALPRGAAAARDVRYAIAFVRANNVWVAGADGRAPLQLTVDGTGMRMVHGREVSYSYLQWSRTGTRLLLARHLLTQPSDGPLRDEWALYLWSPGHRRPSLLVSGITGQDFDPQWSSDGRSVAYMATSRFDEHGSLYQNTVDRVDLSRHVTHLVRYAAHEGCLDGSNDPSELAFWNQFGSGGTRQTFIWSSANHYLVYASECVHTGLTYLDLHSGARKIIGQSMIEAAASPNGKQLAAIDHKQLVVLSPDGSDERGFAHTDGARQPVWSPNGDAVYFTVRTTIKTMRYHDGNGNVFDIEVKRSALKRLDILTGHVKTVMQMQAHAFANVSPSPDGKWIYLTLVSNSDNLYRHLHHADGVTRALLLRYGPSIDLIRIPVRGGNRKSLYRTAGQVSVG